MSSDNSIYQYWIEENYFSQLKATASRVLGESVSIVFQAKDGFAPAITPDEPPKAEPVRVKREMARPASQASFDSRGRLNPRCTFESFVVGINNQFAHAAAMAVAQAPARTYNPLFLHGSVGLGKTHLMQAIGHLIQTNKKHLKVFYVTSEQFTNDYISAIQHGELAKFRKSYRQVDVLLIDDIQFLAGKDRSQEEFYHTFNALCEGSRQIVLTSDSPPTEIANMEKRLTSRFEMGLTAELQLPDAETRLAILAAQDGSHARQAQRCGAQFHRRAGQDQHPPARGRAQPGGGFRVASWQGHHRPANRGAPARSSPAGGPADPSASTSSSAAWPRPTTCAWPT